MRGFQVPVLCLAASLVAAMRVGVTQSSSSFFPSPDPSWPRGCRHTHGVFTGFSRNGHDYDIKYDRFDNPHQSGGPVVFAMHGRTANRQQIAHIATNLACRGYIVITFDHRFHGDRMTTEDGATRQHHAAGFPRNWNYAWDMYYVMETSSYDVDLMIENLQQLNLPKDRKVAVFGESMGGHAAQYAFANNPKIALQASLVSQGNYLEYFKRKYAKLPEEWQQAHPWSTIFNVTLEAKVREKDPVNRLEQFNERPFIALNGGVDHLVPASLNSEMFEELRSQGQYTGNTSDRLQHYIAREGGHGTNGQGWTAEAWERLYEFFENNLPVSKLKGAPVSGAAYRIEEFTDKSVLAADSWKAKMMKSACYNFQHKWIVRDRGDAIALENAATREFLCAASDRSLIPRDINLPVRLSNDAEDRCHWIVSETANGAHMIVNQQYGGKLVVSTQLTKPMNKAVRSQYYKLSVMKGVTDVNQQDLEEFTFHRMD